MSDISAKKPMPPAFIKNSGGGAIKTVADLNTALKGYSSAKNKPQLKAQLIAAAKRLKATHRLPKGWTGAKTESALEEASLVAPGALLVSKIDCPDEACSRWFRDESKLFEHADRVHHVLDLQEPEDAAALQDEADGEPTFSDIEEMVRDAVREEYYVAGDYRATPPIETTWVWVRDLSMTWVVFQVEKGGDDTLFQCSYSILDSKVTLGAPVEVVRKTVYEPVKKES